MYNYIYLHLTSIFQGDEEEAIKLVSLKIHKKRI